MKTVFLLGGYDLEMLEIKKLFEQNSCEYFDKKLSWGAKLSDYKDGLNDSTYFVAIELEEDIVPPKHYTLIDHHGKYSNRKSSLEQIHEFLALKAPLTREQSLISANDSRYIQGMIAISATHEEIQNIRQKDRLAQGVTIKDEQLAEESLKKSENNIISSLTEKFSTISDRIYEKYSRYVIYNERTISFYGYKIDVIKHFLSDNGVLKDDYFYGGGENGFVGLKKDKFTTEQIQKLIEEFKMAQTNEIYSYHTFMFPFRFDYIEDAEGIGDDRQKYFKEHDINKRINLEHLFKKIKTSSWKYKPFEINTDKKYNEYVYFHDFVRDTLYNKKEKLEVGATSYYFEKEINKKTASYTLTAKKRTGKEIYKTKEFSLDISSISLRVFDTGVAILALELENRAYNNLDDILMINDFVRRVYPQFITKSEDYTLKTKESFLPDKVDIELNNQNLTEDFLYKNIPEKINIASYIKDLLSRDIFTTKTDISNKYYIRPIIDDRMYVLSWLGDTGFANKICKDEVIWKNSDAWYKYVFIDGTSKTVQNSMMHQNLIEIATYKRWQGYKTLYGITRYGFVCLSENSDFTRSTLPLPHMKTMYFQMATLLLANRASLLRFSDEVTAISDIQDDTEDLSNNVQSLYKHYIRFVNKLYFREVTAQDQGIELYDMACEQMQIHSQVKDLDNEIAELHSYVQIDTEAKRNKRLENISTLGAVFLPPSLLSGIYGMNVVDFAKDSSTMLLSGTAIILSALLGYFTVKLKKEVAWIPTAGLVLIIVCSLFCFPTLKSSSTDVNQTKGAICQILK